MQQLVASMEVTEDEAVLATLNFRLHFIINRAGSSGYLARVLRGLAEVMSGAYFSLAESTSMRCTDEEHRAIVDAFVERDGPRARIAAVDHFSASGQRAVDALYAKGFWTTD